MCKFTQNLFIISPEPSVAKNLSEKRAGVRTEQEFSKDEAQFCSQIFGYGGPEQAW